MTPERRINRNSRCVKWARQYLKENGIRYRFKWGGVVAGGWSCRGFVQINMTEGGDESGTRRPVTQKQFLSTVFHEAAHIFNAREGKYALYHEGRPYAEYSVEQLKRIRSTAFRAEVYTDHRARKTMKQVFPEVPYWGSYLSDSGRAMFKRYYDKPLQDYIAERKASAQRR